MDGLDLRSVFDARQRVAGVVRRTPLERCDWLSAVAGCDVYLKLECLQRTGSFKLRGAANAVALLGGSARDCGLVAASAGNHGQAVALAARNLDAPATIFVPASAPETKKARIRQYGATLVTVPGIYDDAQAAAEELARRQGAFQIHPFTDPAVVAGQGTVALEVVEELPSVREVVIPVGGGGLAAGMGIALRAVLGGAVRIIGAQSRHASTMHASLEAGRVVPATTGRTLADGLAGGIEAASFERVRTLVDGIVVAEEDWVAEAIRELYRACGVVAEGAGAVGVAAVARGRVELHGPAVVVISGGNIDGDRLAEVLGSDR